MEIRYVYVKSRSQFGKQCFFEDVGPNVEENIFPDPDLVKDYVRRLMVDRYTQKSTQFALHEVQPATTKSKNAGLLHLEGSWPKEIDPTDVEVVERFRRRVTRSDDWISTMVPLLDTMESYIMQNNAINIHGYYFDDMIPTELTISPNMKIVNVYSDQEPNVRPVNHVSWSENTNRLAVAYCSKDRIELPSDFSPNAYIWDIEVTKKPLEILKSASASVAIEFNPRDPSLLISGLMSGQVCSWDTRTGDAPVQISQSLNSHRNPVNQALWISSKSNTEFFSSSNSGTVKWWDIRNMRRPTEVLVMDLEEPDNQDINAAVGVSALQYESTMGSRFLAGLENGIVVNVNRKATTSREKLHTRFDCNLGPVLSIDRNPGSLKNFLTVGDWHAKVWTEETKENCLTKTARKGVGRPTGGCWSRSRLSVFFTIDTKGRLDAYDILQGSMEPLNGIRLGEKPLTTIKPRDDDGGLLAVGSSDGSVYVVRCEGLLSSTFPNDKQLYATYLERCSRYEKLAETRQREIRMAIAQTPVQSMMEVGSIAKSKSKDRSRDTRERIKIKESDREKSKERDTPRKSRPKKSMYRETPFANDATIMEAEKLYFIKVETERAAYDTEESREIEDLYKLHRKAELEELEAQEADSTEVGGRRAEEKARKRPRLRRLRPRKSPGTRIKVSDSLEEIGALIEAESVKSEEFTDRSGRKRRALSEIPLKICPMGVCKPEVCCADVVKAAKEQRELERLKELKKKTRTKRFLSEEEYMVPREKVPVSFRERQKWQSKISEMNRSIPERTPLQKKRILLGKDAPPNVLAEDVKDAKRYLTAWRESLLPKSKSLQRSRSLSAKRKIGEEERNSPKMTRKKATSVQHLATTESRSTIDDIMKMSAKIAEVKSKISMPTNEMLQSTAETSGTNPDEERGVYPRISEAYFPKYPE